MARTVRSEPPLRIGDKADFVRVAQCLKSAGFDESTVCRTLKIGEMADIEEVTPENATLGKVANPLALFIRLFLFMDLMPRTEVENSLDRETLGSLLALDLLRIGEYGADKYYTPVFLYPVAGLIIASDRHSSPDGSAFTPPPDIVFPAIFAGTLRFLRLIPGSPAGDVLDLCSGSGAAALAMSPQAGRSVAADIIERASHYAIFNALLNDCENVEAACGDLYEAVEGRTFDRIVAHPPYMPTPNSKIIWRDGGDTGEVLFQRIIEGLPQHLRRGGTAYVVSLGLDTEEGRLETRARRWLGDSHEEFDIIFALGTARGREEVLDALTGKDKGLDRDDLAQIELALEREKTVKLVYGALVVHRRADVQAPAWTSRVRLSKSTEGVDLEWALRWHQQRLQPNFLEDLAKTNPRLSPSLRVKVTHVVNEGELVPAEFILESAKPFLFATRFDGEVVSLIMQFNGQTTPDELYASARSAAALPDKVSLQDFLKMVAMLIDSGYLVLNGQK